MSLQDEAKKTAETASVLVLDDDPLLLAYISLLLQSRNIAHITAVDNGVDALAHLDDPKQHFDLIISDLVMPAMDGFDFLWMLASRECHIPLIIISAQSEEVRQSATIVAKLKALRLIGNLEKPIVADDFFALLATIIT
jgi:CheY-like chemotaxis protein